MDCASLPTSAARSSAPAVRGRETPVCLEEGTGEQETVSNGILALERKRLIDLDYNLPLQNFDYGPYAAWSRQGSMALTVRGQEVLDVLDIQGIEDENE